MRFKFDDNTLTMFMSVMIKGSHLSISHYLREKHGLHPSKLQFLCILKIIQQRKRYIHFNMIQQVTGYNAVYLRHNLLQKLMDRGYVRNDVGNMWTITLSGYEVINTTLKEYNYLINSQMSKVSTASPAPRAHSG